VSSDPLEYLFSLEQFGIKLGLDNMQAIVGGLGHPERAYRSVHIAGTNGKGSVAALVESCLRAAGLRTGRYTSPHLVHLTERFAIDGLDIDEPSMLAAVAAVRDAVLALQARGVLDVHPTFFEVTTATAFELFRRAAVDVAVCEVGLGGRLDATNVLTPMASAITSIAADHMQHLGSSLEAIAAEKAGIIKPGVPVVLGPLAPGPFGVIAGIAAARGAPVIRAADDVEFAAAESDERGHRFQLRTPHRDYGEVRLALAGDHQYANAAVAVRLLETIDAIGTRVPIEAVREGFATVRWRGRLEIVHVRGGRELLMDAAHNPAGAAALARYLSREAPRPMVFGTMADKDVAGILQPLLPVVAAVIVTRASNRRAASPADLARAVTELAPELPLAIAESPADALELAWSRSRRIVAAGSIFLLGDIMKGLPGS
jgi:dihydrofolate synthase/folylpolyglutamate synthase